VTNAHIVPVLLLLAQVIGPADMVTNHSCTISVLL